MNNNSTIVDLTISSPPSADRSSSTMYANRARSQLPFDVTEGAPSPKRRRVDNSSAAGPSSSSHAPRRHSPLDITDDPDIESIDLTEVNDGLSLQKILSKQREDAINSQHTNGAGRSTLTAYKCPVCMDNCTDATSTVCGHLFCHKCIIDTLRFEEERRAHDGNSKTLRGKCPVCRQALSRIDASGPKRNLVPLQLNLTTKKRT
ncbi:hypothetical protein AJ79_04998 [Helicocarpus griseus UAMH5409]|uniref:RING-type domain-containing protein n=1 Tax=Helicocarpus griseus UAMH5409 TaxID=1447875 RepID=A0A2B7XR81_9EURO|nr:hypothetical protein AJ79_04998 [Helicocarpus griseus UAMH5409]